MKCIYAKTIYTGKAIKQNSYLKFSGTKTTGVSASKNGELTGEFEVVTPAFIDPHSHIGMSRAGEPSGESEANEHLDSILALPDALDSVQMDDFAFRDAIEMGVLYSCVVPGSGNIIGGRFQSYVNQNLERKPSDDTNGGSSCFAKQTR
jgi:imidazolonepropionase-like amidohydrolase